MKHKMTICLREESIQRLKRIAIKTRKPVATIVSDQIERWLWSGYKLLHRQITREADDD